MIKHGISTLLVLAVVSTTVSAKELTLGDVVGGIGSILGGLSNSATSNTPSGVLVKDLPDLPILADKPFVRGAAKIDYAELQRPYSSDNNKRMGSRALGGRGSMGLMIKDYDRHVLEYQADASGQKKFVRSSKLSGFSNPYANDSNAFELSKLNEATRNNGMSIYTYTLKTHFKVPDEFVTQGKVVFEADNPGVQTYVRGHVSSADKGSGFVQMCFHRINNEFLKGQKATYSVKKGNIIDYDLTCYFAGDDGSNKFLPNTIQSIQESNEALSKSWTVYNSKDAGKSYILTNKDMFLYENEVNPVK